MGDRRQRAAVPAAAADADSETAGCHIRGSDRDPADGVPMTCLLTGRKDPAVSKRKCQILRMTLLALLVVAGVTRTTIPVAHADVLWRRDDLPNVQLIVTTGQKVPLSEA